MNVDVVEDIWKIEDRMSNRFGEDWKRYILKEKVKVYKPTISELEELLNNLTICFN